MNGLYDDIRWQQCTVQLRQLLLLLLSTFYTLSITHCLFLHFILFAFQALTFSWSPCLLFPIPCLSTLLVYHLSLRICTSFHRLLTGQADAATRWCRAVLSALCHKQPPSAADVVVGLSLGTSSFSSAAVQSVGALNIIYKCVHLSNPLDFFIGEVFPFFASFAACRWN